MITNLANNIARFFVRKGWGKEEETEIYRYGCEVILSASINVLLVLIIGLLFNKLFESVLFYIFFLLLRRYCGGFHAETYIVCNTVFTAILFFVMLIISHYEILPSPAIVTASMISFLIIVRYSPIVHKDKPLSQSEIVLYRKVAIVLSIILLLIVLFILTFQKKIATIITLAMVATAFTMVVSILLQRREKK